ncbi:Imm7 family immunity protein [Streptomyces sp. H39-S7]|uniref:Imm7 family immunity protein n=1 Tax=Streptomyces sp. H39-S7 TaxID=3004357 RepID=UPI0022AFE765|nr:Imm7 family immunity protein [Streptomyces sp. H39-S7]MCZ4122654.1 Imm7 family immunity protein [Streptomyces sp. H39-S7]
MYEFHGWFGIAESTEEADVGSLSEGLEDLKVMISAIAWATGKVELHVYNGENFVIANGVMNRRRDEEGELSALLNHLASRFPGAWGILYERSDDFGGPPGPGAFRVRTMARGVINNRLDPFLSPCRPIIED